MNSNKHNLPAQPTLFIGRQEELAELSQLLADPSCRLLTLVGLGGIGKTRLAIQAAEQSLAAFTDGVHFVALQPVSSVDFLIPAIAEGIKLYFTSAESPRNQLFSALRQKSALLILDNFEHLKEIWTSWRLRCATSRNGTAACAPYSSSRRKCSPRTSKRSLSAYPSFKAALNARLLILLPAQTRTLCLGPGISRLLASKEVVV